jgi:glutathione synthase/RimK-type ligase-like ATP-grasp enzyme
MRVAILHQDLESYEQAMVVLFAERGVQAQLLDVRCTTVDDLRGCDCVFNRVYASVANRNLQDVMKTLALVEQAEAEGIWCVNGLAAARADYSKTVSTQRMLAAGVRTPACCKVQSVSDIEGAAEFMREHGSPVVVKPDVGGRAIDVTLAFDAPSLVERLGECLAGPRPAWCVQQFVSSVEPFDIRVMVIDGQADQLYGRRLVSASGEAPWIGSGALGATAVALNPAQEWIDLAARATVAIDALINELDMVVAADGPYVIENNPTPAFAMLTEPRLASFADAFVTMLKRRRTGAA